MTAADVVTFDDIVRASHAIAGQVVRTPSVHSESLSAALGCHVVVKFENLQIVASFKARGALNRMLQLGDDERARGVVAMSAGNHAQAVAFHAARLGIDATIVMPESTPLVKVQRTRDLGATVVLHGTGLAESAAEAERVATDEGRVYVHPYDDPAVIAGQGTVALELLADHPDLEVVVVPAGGGGLLAGVGIVARHLLPGIEVVGVQSERCTALAAAFHGREGEVRGPTIAEGIAVPTPGVLSTRLVKASVNDVVSVSEDHIEDAVNMFLRVEKVVAEGAGAAGLAALLEYRERFAGRSVGVILTGGNVDPRLLASIIMRGLARSGALCRLDVEISDVPGALGDVSTIVGRAGANIVEVHHDRMFIDRSVRSAELEVVAETLDYEHVDRVVEALRAAGYRARVGSFLFQPRVPSSAS